MNKQGQFRGDMCHRNPILLKSFQGNRNYNPVNIHLMLEGTTNAFTGAIQLAYNRDQLTIGKLEIRNVHIACLKS